VNAVIKKTSPSILATGLVTDLVTGLTITNLSFSFPHHTLFENFNMTIPSGQWVSILGPTGAGKSTLLQLIAGLINPQKGTITTEGQGPIAGLLAYMSQQDLLLPWLSLLDNVLIGYSLRREPPPALLVEKAKGLLDETGLAHALSLRPAQLSGGMRKRAALVRTILEDKPIVLMDEPFASLDIGTRASLYHLAAKFLAGKTVVFITHDPLEALVLGDQLFVMKGSPITVQQTAIEGQRPRDMAKVAGMPLYAKLLEQLTL
jgi:putative hydroxymethylpyrimidine transport system ATP-binding protein